MPGKREVNTCNTLNSAYLGHNAKAMLILQDWKETLEKGSIMKTSTRDQAEGKLHKMKGEIKETVGELINNPHLKAEGNVEKKEGKAQEKVGKIKKFLGK